MTHLLKHRLQTLMLTAVLGASLNVAIPRAAMAEDGPPVNTISTQGHGEIKVKPDSLSVSVSVESKEPTLAAARADNNRKAQAIIAALKGLNIPGMKLETQNLSVSPVQDYQAKKLPKVIGYQVTNSLEVTVTGSNSDVLGEAGSRIVDTALNAEANNVGGLNFFVSDMATPRTQALELAVKDAHKNAEAMAKAANIQLTGVYSLEGTPQYSNSFRPMAMFSRKTMAAEDAAPAAPVEVGETTVTSDITARYKF